MSGAPSFTGSAGATRGCGARRRRPSRRPASRCRVEPGQGIVERPSVLEKLAFDARILYTTGHLPRSHRVIAQITHRSEGKGLPCRRSVLRLVYASHGVSCAWERTRSRRRAKTHRKRMLLRRRLRKAHRRRMRWEAREESNPPSRPLHLRRSPARKARRPSRATCLIPPPARLPAAAVSFAKTANAFPPATRHARRTKSVRISSPASPGARRLRLSRKRTTRKCRRLLHVSRTTPACTPTTAFSCGSRSALVALR